MAEDRELVCADCGATFVFTSAEQEKYAEKQYAEPKRCPACRAARRAKRKQQSARGPGRGRGQGRGRGRRQQRKPRQRSTIICDACGQEAVVPFIPIPGRPVFCPPCHHAQRDARERESGERKVENW